MKLYTYYTPSHQILKDEWFVPTLQDDYELCLQKYTQDCPSGNYKEEGWRKAMLRKSDLIIQAIKDNWNEIFVYSDIDIQFFRSMKTEVAKLMQGKDLLFQRDSPGGSLCAGFFICRANHKTLKLWCDIQNALTKNDDKNKDDQDILNDLLLHRADYFSDFPIKLKLRLKRFFHQKNGSFLHSLTGLSNPHRITWAYLPIEFFGGGTLTGKHWLPGMSLEVPANIVLHHANWTTGVPNKIAQLKFVKRIVNAHPEFSSS